MKKKYLLLKTFFFPFKSKSQFFSPPSVSLNYYFENFYLFFLPPSPFSIVIGKKLKLQKVNAFFFNEKKLFFLTVEKKDKNYQKEKKKVACLLLLLSFPHRFCIYIDAFFLSFI